MVLETVVNASITIIDGKNPTLNWDAVNSSDVIPRSKALFAFLSVECVVCLITQFLSYTFAALWQTGF